MFHTSSNSPYSPKRLQLDTREAVFRDLECEIDAAFAARLANTMAAFEEKHSPLRDRSPSPPASSSVHDPQPAPAYQSPPGPSSRTPRRVPPPSDHNPSTRSPSIAKKDHPPAAVTTETIVSPNTTSVAMADTIAPPPPPPIPTSVNGTQSKLVFTASQGISTDEILPEQQGSIGDASEEVEGLKACLEDALTLLDQYRTTLSEVAGSRAGSQAGSQ